MAEQHRKQTKIAEVAVALYPGRKHWLIQQAARYFRTNVCRTLIESFAGTAVVGLSLLYAHIIERLILVEKNPAVVCLLNGMLSDPTLVHRFDDFDCTKENVEHVLATDTGAFRWLVLSRVSNRAKWWGGKRTDISCRWCRDVVTTNLRRVYEMRDRVTVIHGDGLEIMDTNATDPTVGCFADPPYSADPSSKGRTIYPKPYNELSHPRLFSTLAEWHGPWLMTQDNTPAVRRLTVCHRLHATRVVMNTSDNIIKNELMITRKRPLF